MLVSSSPHLPSLPPSHTHGVKRVPAGCTQCHLSLEELLVLGYSAGAIASQYYGHDLLGYKVLQEHSSRVNNIRIYAFRGMPHG